MEGEGEKTTEASRIANWNENRNGKKREVVPSLTKNDVAIWPNMLVMLE